MPGEGPAPGGSCLRGGSPQGWRIYLGGKSFYFLVNSSCSRKVFGYIFSCLQGKRGFATRTPRGSFGDDTSLSPDPSPALVGRGACTEDSRTKRCEIAVFSCEIWAGAPAENPGRIVHDFSPPQHGGEVRFPSFPPASGRILGRSVDLELCRTTYQKRYFNELRCARPGGLPPSERRSPAA
jgi:hypothetical protein